jgi:hypothetical protein
MLVGRPIRLTSPFAKEQNPAQSATRSMAGPLVELTVLSVGSGRSVVPGGKLGELVADVWETAIHKDKRSSLDKDVVKASVSTLENRLNPAGDTGRRSPVAVFPRDDDDVVRLSGFSLPIVAPLGLLPSWGQSRLGRTAHQPQPGAQRRLRRWLRRDVEIEPFKFAQLRLLLERVSGPPRIGETRPAPRSEPHHRSNLRMMGIPRE